MKKPINLDAALANADWTKTTWDLPFNNVEQLRAYLQAVGSTVEQFKQRPVYKANVSKLSWLSDL